MTKLEKFLGDREKRVDLQKNLVMRYNKPLLTIRTNYPAENKNEYMANDISHIISQNIELVFDIIHKEIIENLEGKIYLYIIDKNAKEIKKTAMEIEENHILGRLVDIDVFDESYTPLSRKDFGKSKRKCYLCDNLAFICMRKKSHTHLELKEHILKKYMEYKNYELKREKICNEIVSLATKSMILEVASYPSFGLVNSKNNGSHKDMDLFTFIDSTYAIRNGLVEMVKIGYSNLNYTQIFKNLRRIGKTTEKEMFLSTKGVNTHKGMIFLMGITVSAVAKTLYEKKDFSNVSKIIKDMTKNILDDFKNIDLKNMTHGERLYIQNGFTGIRGEISSGLDIIFNGSLEVFTQIYEKNKDINKSATHTLIYLMTRVMDSTIVYRHDIETLYRVQNEMQEIYNNINNISQENLQNLEKRYMSENISPGGSADLLAITIFLYEISKCFTVC